MEKAIVVDELEARELYKTATPAWKKVFEKNFGKDFFSQKITDRIKSYEDACLENGTTPMNENLLLSAGLTDAEIVRRKLVEITKAFNGDWVADIFNRNQKKYYAYYNLSSGGFVFYVTNYYYSGADAGFGSRLWFQNPEHAEYAAKQFVEYYKILAEN